MKIDVVNGPQRKQRTVFIHQRGNQMYLYKSPESITIRPTTI